MNIREEKTADLEAVYRVNVSAFERNGEADLVNALRLADDSIISLVAEEEGHIIGHALFSPVIISGFENLSLMALGPIAVVPNHQKEGVGSSLIKEGLEICQKKGCEAVFVLGHSEYYPRFGFVPSTKFGIVSEFGVPEEVFMAQELKVGSLDKVSGTVNYHSVFKSV